MSLEDLKQIFGSNEAVLELIQREDGALVLRNTKALEDEPILSFQFHEKIREAIGDDVHLVAQHMIQAAFFTLLDQQIKQYKAETVDEKPEHLS